MWPSDRREFLRELDATDETYVREKLVLGGYKGWQIDAVKFWLDQRQTQRDQQHRATELTLSRQRTQATRMRVAIAVVGVLITAAIHWYATH